MSSGAGDGPVAVVILSWNTVELLRACLCSLQEREQGVELEVLVVDNGSADGSAEMVEREFPAVQLLRNPENRGYAGGNNQGVAATDAPFVLLLNSDTEVTPGAIGRLRDHLIAHPELGAVAPRLSNPDGSVQRACMRFPNLRVALLYDSLWERWFGRPKSVRRYFMEDFDHLHSCDVDQPPGACLLLPRAVWDAVGGFDESLWLFFNDVDLCKKIVAAGHRLHYLAEAEVVHHGGRSTSQFPEFVRVWNVNRVRYYRKHHGWLGVLAVKCAVTLRALEESVKVLRRAPRGTRRAGLGQIGSVWRETLAT